MVAGSASPTCTVIADLAATYHLYSYKIVPLSINGSELKISVSSKHLFASQVKQTGFWWNAFYLKKTAEFIRIKVGC
jgi:hypothetical protein